MVIMFCGHSKYTPSVDDEQRILSLLEEIAGESTAELYLGGYGSFDEFARKCGRKFQQTHANTKLIFVTPYMTVEYQKNHLNYYKKLYDEIIYPDLEKVPPKFAISHRNKWMADKADFIIAYVDCSWGGAYPTYRYAKKKGKEVINLMGKEL